MREAYTGLFDCGNCAHLRHCEERSDEAIQAEALKLAAILDCIVACAPRNRVVTKHRMSGHKSTLKPRLLRPQR